MRARARKAAGALAGELLNLYAERRRRSGHAYPPDSDWQREFEEREQGDSGGQEHLGPGEEAPRAPTRPAREKQP